MNKTILSTMVLAAGLLAPAAIATPWYSYGTYEPSTSLDRPGFMWPDAPGENTRRVYFNAFTTWGDTGNNGAFLNPNVGALQTNLDPAGTIYFEAILGVWTDCNRDGYVGMLETAVREYSDHMLLDKSLCPALTNQPKNKWAGGNNYNGWVTELIPIGNSQTTNGDTKLYKDSLAAVWADTGKPDDPVAPSDGTTCVGAVRGTWQSTGALVAYYDCRYGFVETFNEVDGTLGTGLGFGDDPASSPSPLNRPTFGSDSSDHSAVYLQDCSEGSEPIATTGDLPGEDADNIALLRPVPADPVGDPNTATIPGTVNYTVESIYTPDNTFGTGDGNTANCDFEDDEGQDFYGFLEGDVDLPANGGKDAVWDNFRFQTASRGTLPAAAIGSGSAGVPTDFGIQFLGVECGPSSCFESQWFGEARTYITPTVDSRVGLDGVNADVAKAPWYSFYAYVGPETTSRGFLLPGLTGVYGAAQCGSNDSGQHNGWNCDSDAWYLRSDGSYPEPGGGVGIFAKVGDRYNLRDVDCFDGELGDTGLGASPAFYGPAPCT